MRLTALLLACGLTLAAFAAVTGWRTDGTGAYPKAAPQTAIAPANAIWTTELPAWSNALPVIVGDRIIVCTEPSTLVCLDRDGKILWQRTNTYEDLLNDADKAKLADERAKLAPVLQKENELNRTRGGLQRDLNQANKDLKDKPDDADLKTKVDKLTADIAALDPQLAAVREEKKQYAMALQYLMPSTHPSNGYSSNTVVSDGKNIWVVFGTGVVACYALDGTRVWARLVEKPVHPTGWGHSASPALVGDTLVVQLLDSFGLNAKTGEERWRRKLGKIWGSPQPIHLGAIDAVITDIGEILNVADGKSLGSTKMNLDYGSYLVIGDTVYGASGPNARAYKLALAADGTVTVTQLWQAPVKNDRYYASPLYDGALVYVVNAGGTLTILDAATGEKKYEQALNLGGCIYPSPTLVGNTVLVGSESGKAVVFAAGAAYQEMARVTLDSFRACPVADGRRLYIRTCAGKSKLYCFEAPAQ